jgi:hypothetical protein
MGGPRGSNRGPGGSRGGVPPPKGGSKPLKMGVWGVKMAKNGGLGGSDPPPRGGYPPPDRKSEKSEKNVKKWTSLDPKFHKQKSYWGRGGVKFLRKWPCGALFFTIFTIPPLFTINLQRRLGQKIGQARNFRFLGYQKMHIFCIFSSLSVYHRG